MTSFFATLVGVVAVSILGVSANQHVFTVPESFPVGPALSPPPLKRAQLMTTLDEPTLAFEARLDGIYLNGEPFNIKGASYFGMETGILVPHGLWGGNESTTIQKVATLLTDNKFNAVRLPLGVDAVLTNPEINIWVIANEVDLFNEFYDKKPLRYFDVLDHVIKVLADNKLLVLLDAHVLNHESGGITELWYTSEETKDDFENAWKILANRYKDTWNVFAVDLENEPHGAVTWGSNDNATDFRLAALKWATNILEIAPRWLIFVEGQQFSSRDVAEWPTFWGENLMDVQRAPLTLPIENRLVYSPHVYGPDVYVQPYFGNATYPDNMPEIWDFHFGFAQGVYGPLVVGEWGGGYRNEADRKWQDKFASFLKERNIGSFTWCINPNGGDTGGLLENDWNTPRTDKLTMLSIFEGTPLP